MPSLSGIGTIPVHSVHENRAINLVLVLCACMMAVHSPAAFTEESFNAGAVCTSH